MQRKNTFSKYQPSVNINLVQSCLKIISCFYQPDIIRVDSANITELCNYLIAFAVIWSIGANIDDKSRSIFAREVKLRFSGNVNFNDSSNSSIYDICINVTNASFDRFFRKRS